MVFALGTSHTHRPLWVTVTGVIASVALVAGCGSSGSGSSSSGATITATADTSAAEELPAELADSKTLVVGVALGSPPDEFEDENGEIVGWEVDIVRTVAQTLGLELELKPDSFDSLLPGLQADRYDVAIGQMGITGERKEVADFVSTLLSNQLFAARTEENLKVESLDDLCGRSVATTRGSRQYEFGKAQSAKCEADGEEPVDIKAYIDSNQAGLALTSKRADLFWLGATAVAYYVKQTDGATEVVGEHLDPNPIGIASRKGDGVAEAVQAAMQSLIDEGTYAKILKKWGLEENTIGQAEVNPEVDDQ